MPIVITYRGTEEDLRAFWAAEVPVPEHSVLCYCLPVVVQMIPDLTGGVQVQPLEGEVRELAVSALAEALVSAYKRKIPGTLRG